MGGDLGSFVRCAHPACLLRPTTGWFFFNRASRIGGRACLTAAVLAATPKPPDGCLFSTPCAACSKMRQEEDFLWERQVWSYFLQVALGVQYLHHNHVLHRQGGGLPMVVGAQQERGAGRACPARQPPRRVSLPCRQSSIWFDASTLLLPGLLCRDLKPQNIMLTKKDGSGLLKVSTLHTCCTRARFDLQRIGCLLEASMPGSRRL